MRLAILGNSGSGKSTLARWLSAYTRAATLDLDTVAWQSGQIAVARDPDDAAADVGRFCSENASWVVEGCYANLICESLKYGPRLVFLHPGELQCVEHCKSRPWEPHKYKSRQLQDSYLEALLDWVRGYYSRDGQMSLLAHEECYKAYTGPKEMVTRELKFDPPGPQVLAWTVAVEGECRR